MMASLRFLLVYLSIWIGHAVAGSRFWQPSLRDEPELQKRYFHVNPKAGERGYESTVWPDKKIRVCYENQATREKFHLDLMAAHQTWVTAGLGSDFKIEEAPEADCADQEKLKDLLLVKAGSGLSTTVGFLTEDSIRRTSHSTSGINYGPEMTLTDDESIGMLSKIPNYAHELGHAMGLYHEHQNPQFWSGSGIENAEGGSVFGPDNNGNWRCENLKDYARHNNGLVVQNPRGRQTIGLPDKCKQWSYARQDRFSAADYLPMPEHLGFSPPGKDGKDVDWKSIMIYPSGAGAADGGDDPKDPRMPILLDHHGKRIPKNLSPSQLDIHALRGMYGVKANPKRRLLNKVQGFQKVYDLSKGSSGCL